MNDEDLVAISDMYFVAALISYQISYKRINRDNPRRLEFMFEDKPSKVYLLHEGTIAVLEFLHLDQIQAAYTSNTLMFPPSYPDAIRRVKSAIHAQK